MIELANQPCFHFVQHKILPLPALRQRPEYLSDLSGFSQFLPELDPHYFSLLCHWYNKKPT